MAKTLDPAIGAILKDHGFGKEAVWDCHGTWVVYHRVLEQIAAQGRIAFEPPLVLEANGVAKTAAICVTGKLGDKAEWSIGEAAPGNNKTAYPFAMAEKRAKDRVILKLIGLHGLVYSEEEADDFKGGPVPQQDPAQPEKTAEERVADELIATINATATTAALDAATDTAAFKAKWKALSLDARARVNSAGINRRLALGGPPKAKPSPLREQLVQSLAAEKQPVNLLPAG